MGHLDGAGLAAVEDGLGFLGVRPLQKLLDGGGLEFFAGESECGLFVGDLFLFQSELGGSDLSKAEVGDTIDELIELGFAPGGLGLAVRAIVWLLVFQGGDGGSGFEALQDLPAENGDGCLG